MAKRNTYIATWLNIALAPGFIVGPVVAMNNACRRMFLTCITWDVFIHDVTINRVVPLEINQFVRYAFALTAIGSGLQYANIMTSIIPPAPNLGNTQILLHEPGQYFFNDMQFENEIRINVGFINLSPGPGDEYEITSSVIIETKG
jgi:hypothetical protein